LLKHYAPDATIQVYEGERDAVNDVLRERAQEGIAAGQRVGLLLMNADVSAFRDLPIQIVLLGSTLDEAATHLFAGMRELDAAEVDLILVRAPERDGVGLALYDRLQRAAEGQMQQV